MAKKAKASKTQERDEAASERVLAACASIASLTSTAVEQATSSAAPFLSFAQRSRIRAMGMSFDQGPTGIVVRAPAPSRPAAVVSSGDGGITREEIDAIVAHRVEIAVTEALQRIGVSPDSTIKAQIDGRIGGQIADQENRILDYVRSQLTDSLRVIDERLDERLGELEAARRDEEVDEQLEQAREDLLKNIDEVRTVDVSADQFAFAAGIVEVAGTTGANPTTDDEIVEVGDGEIEVAGLAEDDDLGELDDDPDSLLAAVDVGGVEEYAGEVEALEEYAGEVEALEEVEAEPVEIEAEPVEVEAEPVEVEAEPVEVEVEAEPVEVEAEPVEVEVEAEPVEVEAEPVEVEVEAEPAEVEVEAEPVEVEAEPVEVEVEAEPVEVEVEAEPAEVEVEAEPAEVEVEAEPAEVEVEAEPVEVEVEAEPADVEIEVEAEPADDAAAQVEEDLVELDIDASGTLERPADDEGGIEIDVAGEEEVEVEVAADDALEIDIAAEDEVEVEVASDDALEIDIADEAVVDESVELQLVTADASGEDDDEYDLGLDFGDGEQDDGLEELSVISPAPEIEEGEAQSLTLDESIELDPASLAELSDDDEVGLGTLGAGPDEIEILDDEDDEEEDVEVEIDEEESDDDHADDQDEDGRAAIINKYMDRALQMGARQQFTPALELYSKVLELDRKHFDALVSRGVVYSKTKDYRKATEDFRQAQEIAPERAGSYYGLAELHYNRRQFNKAIKNYNQALERDDQLAEAYCRRGLSYYYLKNYKVAFHDLYKAYDINPDLPKIRSFLKLVQNKIKESEG